MRAEPIVPARTPRRGNSARLERAVLALSGGHGRIVEHRERSWASITFAGTRHTLRIAFDTPEAIDSGEALIAREAERVQLASPTDRDVRDERRRLEGLAGGAARLTSLTDALGVDDEEIDAMARRRAMVKVFLEANLQGAATIDDAQIDRIYQSGEHPFQGQELEDVREPMRVWLTRRALENSVRRWVEVLRARTTIRVLAPYGGNR